MAQLVDDQHQCQRYQQQHQPDVLDLDSEACLLQVLALFPDISHAFVRGLYSSESVTQLRRDGSDYLQALIEAVLDKPSYPKEREMKRKRRDEDDAAEQQRQQCQQPWQRPPDAALCPDYSRICVNILANDFPSVPIQAVRSIFEPHRRLYPAYQECYAHENALTGHPAPYKHLKKPRKKSVDPYLWSPLPPGNWQQEHEAARAECEKKGAAFRREQDLRDAEALNERTSRETGAILECQCCFTDVPVNRTVGCDTDTAHYFCFGCVRKAADTAIGLMKYELRCFDVSGCGALFTRSGLQQALDSSAINKLEALQQQDEIAKAGLEGLADCPFCDFKAICPPATVDKEFRCLNVDCERVSCRICRQESHIPLSCAEYKKEQGYSERRLIEEAMSEALIRKCPRCSIAIVKEDGCNKMVCSKCSCIMCYVCKADITKAGYAHFRMGPATCTLHDERFDRHQNDIDQAERAAIDKVRTDHPDLEPDLLRVQKPDQRVPFAPNFNQRVAAVAAEPLPLPPVGLLGLQNLAAFPQNPYPQDFALRNVFPFGPAHLGAPGGAAATAAARPLHPAQQPVPSFMFEPANHTLPGHGRAPPGNHNQAYFAPGRAPPGKTWMV